MVSAGLSSIPFIVINVFWGIVGIVVPFFVKGHDRQIIRVSLGKYVFIIFIVAQYSKIESIVIY